LAITLRVEWSNKDDELLTQDARPHVHVSAGGVEVPSKPSTSSRPFPEYEIPDTAQSVRVELAVIGTINLKYAEQSRPWRRFRDDISKSRIARQRDLPLLLWAAQEFRVMRSGNVPLEPVEPLHPLMVCLAAGSAVGTVAIVRVWTDFLDVTDYFFEFAARTDQELQDEWKESQRGDRPQMYADIYHAAHARENSADQANPMHMTVLGFTGGKPKIWFATYCEPRLNNIAGPDVGSFVYYRPNTDAYSKVCEIHKGMMDRNNRYFLAPNEQEFREGVIDAADRIKCRPAPGGGFFLDFQYVRIGIDQAIRRSGKSVVFVVPYPHAHDYGRSATADMPSLVEALLRFMHGNGEIGRTQPGVKLGRLGIGGFSAGGLPMGAVFRQCNKRILELYLFDSTGAWGYADQAIRWGWSTPDARLRISMGYNEKPMNSIFLNTLDFIRKKGAGGLTVNSSDNVTAWPHFTTGEEFLKAYENHEWWQYHVAEVAACTKIDIKGGGALNARHQFAMFGGEQRPVTFLEQLLRQSGY